MHIHLARFVKNICPASARLCPVSTHPALRMQQNSAPQQTLVPLDSPHLFATHTLLLSKRQAIWATIAGWPTQQARHDSIAARNTCKPAIATRQWSARAPHHTQNLASTVTANCSACRQLLGCNITIVYVFVAQQPAASQQAPTNTPSIYSCSQL
jgi:hypothetical protein